MTDPTPQTTPTRDEAVPDDIRALGWTVAVHNDYRLDGEPHTFWLFTKDGKAIKGEGRSDAEALGQVRAMLASAPAPASGGVDAVACRHEPYLGECAHCGIKFKDGRPAALSPAATPVSEAGGEPAMTDAQIKQWIEACNHEPARETLRYYLRLRALAKPASSPAGGREQGFVDGYDAALQAVEVFRIKIGEPFDSTFEQHRGFVRDMLRTNAEKLRSSLSQSTSAGRVGE